LYRFLRHSNPILFEKRTKIWTHENQIRYLYRRPAPDPFLCRDVYRGIILFNFYLFGPFLQL